MRLASLSGVEAILAVHGAVSTRNERHTRFRAALGTHGVVHHAAIAAIAIGVSRLGIFSQQERIEGIGAHVEVDQVAIASLAITLSTCRAQHRSRQAMQFAKLSLGGGIFKIGITLLADYRRGHWSSHPAYAI